MKSTLMFSLKKVDKHQDFKKMFSGLINLISDSYTVSRKISSSETKLKAKNIMAWECQAASEPSLLHLG